MDDYIKENLLIEVDCLNPEDTRGGFYINPFVIDNSLPEINLGRWWSTVQMCRLIRQYGLRTFEDYEADNLTRYVDVGAGPFILQGRKDMQPHIKKLGSTSMLTFCSDYHDEFLDHIEQNWTFEDFINWGKKEFIFVEFKDLAYFDFPEKEPDCFNVMILDNFEDLKI